MGCPRLLPSRISSVPRQSGVVYTLLHSGFARRYPREAEPLLGGPRLVPNDVGVGEFATQASTSCERQALRMPPSQSDTGGGNFPARANLHM